MTDDNLTILDWHPRRRRPTAKMSCYVYLLTVFYLVALATAGIMGDECDWTGSGLTTGSSRGVTPVYLRCRAGRITWLYPRGALRVILRLHNSNKDFKVCVKVAKHSSKDFNEDTETDLYPEDEVLDFREDVYTTAFSKRPTKKEEAFPARLFLEGGRGLIPLYASDDGSGRYVRCFRSKNGQAAIYVEATPEVGEQRRAARLQYDLQPLPAKAYDPAAEECRPCTVQELAHAFCTGDLVARGVIVGMQERNELDTSELTVKITKLIRYVNPDGHTYTADTGAPHNNSSEYQRIRSLFYEDEIDDDIKGVNRNVFNGDYIENQIGRTRERKWDDVDKRTWFARIQAGAQCGVSTGAGEFLISARRRLGSLFLACAPRLSEWKSMIKQINEEGTAHCVLTT